MPELPEVEVTRRSFAQAIAGARVTAVRLGKPLRWPLGADGDALLGRCVLGVRRRGKYLLVDLDDGILLVHLGMSGSLRFAHGLPPPGPHDHFDLTTTQGTLRLHDPRRFGAVVHAAGEADPVAHKLLGALGMEPLSDDFTLESFSRGIKASRTPIKQMLLGGKVVVGVGNIYASEVLFLSGIRPQTPSARIGPARTGRLHAAIRQVLERAVELGGSTLKDFSNADGAYGSYQAHANVYGREGAPCKVCGTPIKALRQGQRASYFCPRCQRA